MSRFRDLSILYYLPGRRLANLGAVLVDSTGGISELCEVMRGIGVEVIAVDMSRNPENFNEAYLSLIVDISKLSDEQIEDIVMKLRQSENFKEITLHKSDILGLISDMFFDYRGVLGRRALIISYAALTGFFQGLYDLLGDSAGAFLYHAGKLVGIEGAKSHREYLNVSDVDLWLRIAGRFLRSLGYARELNIARIDGGIEAVLIDSLECQIQAKLRRIPSSNWTRGLIAGIATDLMERDCSAEEVECINLGYPHCRIVAKKTS
ncbi:MAG: hypothetical protein QXI11_02190 [Thermoproteota archaeon]